MLNEGDKITKDNYVELLSIVSSTSVLGGINLKGAKIRLDSGVEIILERKYYFIGSEKKDGTYFTFSDGKKIFLNEILDRATFLEIVPLK